MRNQEVDCAVVDLLDMRAAIEAEGIRLLFDDKGTAAGIARKDVEPVLSPARPAGPA
jgi:hypothetical protein